MPGMNYSVRITTTLAPALLVWLIAATGVQAALTVTDVGRYDFTDTSGSGARELSGITYTGGVSYYAVGDKNALLHTLSIGLDPATGQITSATIGPSPVTLAGGTAGDREGIALQGGQVLLSNESGPRLEAYDAITGLSNGPPITTAQPGFGVYANIRPNRAWESLAVYPSNPSTILTANEDALTVDGPAAGFTQGAFVRIQAASVDASNSTATAIGQFAYPIDAINGDNLFVTGETSGLVDLVTLPGGQVLAMERAVGLTGYRIRLYQINGEAATDISDLPGLAGLTPDVDYTPLGKSLLWEKTFGATTNSNFEGIALGPTLATGERSLVLVADNASGPVLPIIGQQWTVDDQSLYALTQGFDPGSECGFNCLIGDNNEDGFVGVDDLNLILSRWNQTVFPGTMSDPNTDGFVGVDDLNIVLTNWNNGVPPSVNANIPEPATAATIVLLSLYRVIRRSRI
jgi:Esterase-like activity of phytase